MDAQQLAEPQPASVLLVDDDPNTRFLVKTLLGRTKRFRVVGEAASGLDGVRQAAVLRPDVVVLDVDLPDIQGTEALPLVRKAAVRAKIVLFSDRVLQFSAAETRRLGADMFVPKGLDCRPLVDALLNMVRMQGSLDQPGHARPMV